MDRRQLPVLNGHVAESSLYTDGTRKKIEPPKVHGPWATARRVTFAVLIGIWLLLPSIPIGGRPALFLDVEHRRFFIFGGTFAPQDSWLLFLLAAGMGLGLIAFTAVLGRVWCGWACPQTVFMEAFYRPIERLTKSRFARHALFAVASFGVAHIFIAYFVSLKVLWKMMLGSPLAHPEAFAWMLALTAVFYVQFAHFREQFCVVLCPYGRLQSVLLDDASLVIAYDEKRGEPRGKKGQTEGDCVDCRRCIVVCPTGIDIRNGLQMDCVACTACIDACDDIMTKLGRPTRLIRYVRGKMLRPRVVLYALLLAFVWSGFAFASRSRATFEATMQRQPGTSFHKDETGLRNDFTIHVVNKSAARGSFTLEPIENGDTRYLIPVDHFEVEPHADRRIPVIVSAPPALRGRPLVRVRVRTAGEEKVVEATFLGGVP